MTSGFLSSTLRRGLLFFVCISFCLTNFAQLRVLPLGNSITEAMNDGVSVMQNSYRRALYQLLTGNGYSVDFVGSQNTIFSGSNTVPANHPNNDFDLDHEGHWGRKIDWFLVDGRLNSWLQTYTPDVALLHLGTNDMIQNDGVASTIAELEDIVDTLRAYHPNITIYIAQLIPRTHTASNTRITSFNAAIPAIQTSMSLPNSPIYIVDQNTGFDAATDTYDGTHPNNTGEAKMAQIWYNALTNTVFPVEWAHFDGSLSRKTLQLNWTTTEEQNNQGFEVQHWNPSLQQYEALAFVDGKNTAASYTYSQPWLIEGKQYFRLKQIDLDGRFTFSRVLSLQQAGTDVAFQVFPIPARNELFFRFADPEIAFAKITIVSLSGQQLLSHSYTQPAQEIRLPIETLTPGSYLAQVRTPLGSESRLILVY